MTLKLGAKHTVSGPSVNKHVGIFSEEEDQEVWSPPSPELYIWDHNVSISASYGDGTGYSISQVPANFNFIGTTKIDEYYNGLADVAAQKGETIYKGRIELERKAIKEVYQSIQSSHNTLILKWKCRGDHVPFGGGGGLQVSVNITVVEFLPPDGLETRRNLHLARLNYPPSEHIRNGINLDLQTIRIPTFPGSSKRMVFVTGPHEQIQEIHRVKYTTDQRTDIRTEEGPSWWTIKNIDSYVKAEITMVSGHVVTKQIVLN